MTLSRASPAESTTVALLGAIAGSFFSVLPVFLLAALATQLAQDLAVSPERIIATGSTLFLWSAVLSIPGGRVTDRLGGRTTLRVSLALSGSCLVALSVFGGSLRALVLLAAVGGAANALAVPSGNALLLRHSVAERHGLVYGVKQSAIPAASLIAGTTLSVAGSGQGWELAFLIGGALAFALAVGMPLQRLATSYGLNAEQPASDAPSARHLVRLAAVVGLASAAATATATYIAASAIRSGLSPEGAGVVLSVASAAGISVRVLAGVTLDRRGLRPSLMGHLMLVGSAGALVLALGRPLAAVVGSFVALAAGWGWQGLYQHHISSVYASSVGRATGFMQAGLAGGAVGGPVAFGTVAAGTSYTMAWVLTGTCFVIAGWGLGRLLHPKAGPPVPPRT